MAGSRFVEITLEDMEAFLKRAYHMLRPRVTRYRGQYVIDLTLSDDHSIFVRVYTSIFSNEVARTKGKDSIKVAMLADTGGAEPKGLMRSQKLVMRTTNWRSSVQDRVDEMVEIYESKVEYWKGRRLNVDPKGQRSSPLDEAIEESLPDLTPKEREQLEDAEAENLQEEENSQEEQVRPRTVPPVKMPGITKTKVAPDFEGGYKSLPGGGWGVALTVKGKPGAEGMGVTKGGQRKRIRLLELKQSFRDRYNGNVETELWTFEEASGKPRQQYSRNATDTLVASVVARYLNA